VAGKSARRVGDPVGVEEDEPVPGREGRDDARQLPFECPDDGGCIRKILGVEHAIRLTDDMIKANAVPSDVPLWHRTTRWWPTGD